MTVRTRSVGSSPEGLRAVAVLFDAQRNTRHCWCTAFCSSSRRFTAGWFLGGNRRRFEGLAVSSPAPMGVLASADGAPVGWCACGPRSRYLAAIDGRSELLRHRPRAEDDEVWLVACLFVAPARRGRGVTHALVQAAVDLARGAGAVAIEGWPLAAGAAGAAEAFLGREEVFEAAGFACVDRPTPQRALMRLDLLHPQNSP